MHGCLEGGTRKDLCIDVWKEAQVKGAIIDSVISDINAIITLFLNQWTGSVSSREFFFALIANVANMK